MTITHPLGSLGRDVGWHRPPRRLGHTFKAQSSLNWKQPLRHSCYPRLTTHTRIESSVPSSHSRWVVRAQVHVGVSHTRTVPDTVQTMMPMCPVRSMINCWKSGRLPCPPFDPSTGPSNQLPLSNVSSLMTTVVSYCLSLATAEPVGQRLVLPSRASPAC